MTWAEAKLDPRTEAFLQAERDLAAEQVPDGFHLAFVQVDHATLVQAVEFATFIETQLRNGPDCNGIWLRAAELSLLHERVAMIAADAPDQSGTLSAVLYLRDLKNAALLSQFPNAKITATVPAQSPSGPARFAIIDDGIPFLNRRFRRQVAGHQHSRFLSVWMQKPGAAAHCGRVMERDAISAHFPQPCPGSDDDHFDEAACYRKINQGLSPAPWHRRASEQRMTHGAMVLDLAAGADPQDASDPMRAVDILAVQLATQSVKDSSGRRLRQGIHSGLCWIVRRALQDPTPRPLVVNISLGAMDGPRVSTAGYAARLAHEADLYKALSGQELTITAAFGNAFTNRQVATIKPDGRLRNDAPAEIAWRVLPEDRSESLLQIRLIAPADRMAGKTLRDVQIQIIAPGQPPSPWLDVTDGASMAGMNGAVRYWCAMVEQGKEVMLKAVLALNPTAPPQEPQPNGTPPDIAALAPAGGYIIRVRNSGEPVELALQIQRDDTPPGFSAHGRQSYFDHHDAYGWDVVTKDWQDRSAAPITGQGSYSDLCAERSDAIKTVSALFHPSGAPTPQPARYSAEGCKIGVIGGTKGPEFSMVVDTSRFRGGQRACGVLSGSAGRLSGTSAAAPLLARHILLGQLPAPLPPIAPETASRIGVVIGG